MTNWQYRRLPKTGNYNGKHRLQIPMNTSEKTQHPIHSAVLRLDRASAAPVYTAIEQIDCSAHR